MRSFKRLDLLELTDWVEVQTNGILPRSRGWGVLMLAIIGITVLPISGFWLLLPVAIGSLWQTKPTSILTS